MCLILFRYQPGTRYPLIVAANRDEFYARPAKSAHYWPDNPNVFAGRDETAGGTWLGVTRDGRFAALTNFSAGDPARDYPQSRGALVADFLTGTATAADYANSLNAQHYAGFNLLVFDGTSLHYATNKGYPNRSIDAGAWGLSNAELDASWPKSVDGAEALAAANPESASIGELLAVLSDDTPPPDQRLPERPHMSTMPLEQRRALAARFIAGSDYGTRAMTVIKLGATNTEVFEQQIGPGGVRGSAVFARVPRPVPAVAGD